MAEWTQGKCYLKILSNLADRRICRARAVWKCDDIGGPEVVDGIIAAYQFAAADPYRAATHNKGIMNGISAVVLATGNDTRAIEAGAHAYASRKGWYTSLTDYEVTADGDLAGSIELPLAVGIVGGATKAHPMAQISLDLMQVRTRLADVYGCLCICSLRAYVPECVFCLCPYACYPCMCLLFGYVPEPVCVCVYARVRACVVCVCVCRADCPDITRRKPCSYLRPPIQFSLAVFYKVHGGVFIMTCALRFCSVPMRTPCSVLSPRLAWHRTLALSRR